MREEPNNHHEEFDMEARASFGAASVSRTFVTAVLVGLTFVGSIFNGWVALAGLIPIGVGLIGWGWPNGTPEAET